MNGMIRLVAALALGGALGLTSGCGSTTTTTAEPKPTGTEQVARPPEKKGPEKKEPEKKGPPEKAITPGTKVSAQELAREFKADWDAASAKYVGKTFTVDGKLKDIEVAGKETHMILGDPPSGDGPRLAFAMKGYLKTSPFSHSRGQQLRVEGRCHAAAAGTVSFADCAITGADNDTILKTTASALLAAYRTDAEGDAKYKGKLIQVENVEVEKLPQDGALVMIPFGRIPGSKPLTTKIRVKYNPSYKPLFPQLKAGGLATFSGRCEGASGGEVVLKDAWFLPYIPVP